MKRGPLAPGLFFLFCLLAQLAQGQVSGAFVESHADRLAGLFAHLDTDQPAMAAIQALWESGERAGAANALSAYFRDKAFSLDLLDPPLIPANAMEQAEAALEGRFFLLNQWEPAPLDPDGTLNWDGRGSRNDKERAWMLNRHAFLLYLAEAASRTGEARFSKSLNRLWTDWILANPYPNRLSFSAPWRALEVARRILNAWVYIFYGYNALDDETRLLVLCSVLDHADALSEHASFWGGNHLITEKMALLAIAAAWPEFKSSGKWRDDAIGVISSEFLSQTYPDGSYKELSNHYQRVVLTNTIKFLKLLEVVDPAAENKAVVRRIETMWDFFARVMRPDGFGPLNNAADTEHNAAYVKEVWERFDRPDWLYMATNGTEGTAPSGPDTNPSRLFEWAGQAILRTGWERDAGWVYFDAGPYGTAHQHIDRLHVSAALNGRPLLVDNGRYTYQPGPWKDYFQGPASHNVLLLDGQPAEQAPREVTRPLEILFEETEIFAFAAATALFRPTRYPAIFSGLQPSIPWTRAVLLDKEGRFVLILDHLLSFRDHTWTARWHFDPQITEAQATSALVLASPKGTARPRILTGATEPSIAGFFSPEYNVKQPAVQMEFSGHLDGPTTLIWLLSPPGSNNLTVEVISDPAGPVQQLVLLENGAVTAEATVQLYPKPRLIRPGTQ